MLSPRFWFLSGLSLILTACPATPVPSPPGTSATSVTGTIVEANSFEVDEATRPWSGGAGRVDGETATGAVIATGTLEASGAFTLPLPATVPASALHPFNADNAPNLNELVSQLPDASCTGTPKFSTQSAQLAFLDLFAVGTVTGHAQSLQARHTTSQTTTATGTVYQQTDVTREGGLVYLDAPVTVTGTVTCTGNSGTVRLGVSFNVEFAKGWNRVTQEVTDTRVLTETPSGFIGDAEIMLTLTSGVLPREQWVVLSPPLPSGQHVNRPGGFFMRPTLLTPGNGVPVPIPLIR
ncbi:hypothetical protein HNQ07_000631 [Deinococcus metalli]|uniref:Uncharacterized protein n=1 Tax=Deinococcus metalli TaxID=1141878 RepID=A0A7W8NQJ3_9DEIO|nr:hypothetical protein [Deinococcus metalli]MBB5375187.1 hypothetical protein [Deinococcus metalli]GHF31095.1 hypothetical protein GCM10017781_04090 [Deinococcus metalli]